MLILCYHAVSDEWSNALAVTTSAFERQLQSLLKRRFRPVTAADLLQRRGRLLHVTFDDAYQSVRNAVPVLERLGIPSTIFAASSYAVNGRPLDVPELAEEASAHPDHLATMDWEELRELAARGTQIGSHTKSHPHLPLLSDTEIERELRESKLECEDALGRPCRFLAYPYGEHDARVRTAVQRVGYEAAFALRAEADPGNHYALPRVGLYQRDSQLRATLKTSVLGEPGAWLLARARAAATR